MIPVPLPTMCDLPFPADVSVAIVAHNAIKTLPATLESLRAAGCPETQMTLVDVASTDGSREQITRTFHGLRIRRLDVNKGPSPARNLAILAATTPYVFLMDGDVLVEPATVSILRAAMSQDSSIAVGSPIVVYADRPDIIQYAGTGFHFVCEAVNPWLDRPLAERGSAPLFLGAASTCGLLLARAPAIAVGLFDERYFIGKEDGDFTHRIALAGYRILELPHARVRHQSRPRGAWLFPFQIRNRWHVMLKNYQARTILCLIPVLVVHELLQALVLIGKGHGRAYVKAVAGLLALLPSLLADRARVAKIRMRPDRELMRSDAIVARHDLVGHPILQHGQVMYERMLRGYWRLIAPLLAR